MIAWKLFRQMADGSIAPLFIDKRSRITEGEWLPAECVPTKGFKVRKGWHCTSSPSAPHLSERGRVWRQVEIRDYEEFVRPPAQGGLWFIAQAMRLLPAAG